MRPINEKLKHEAVQKAYKNRVVVSLPELFAKSGTHFELFQLSEATFGFGGEKVRWSSNRSKEEVITRTREALRAAREGRDRDIITAFNHVLWDLYQNETAYFFYLGAENPSWSPMPNPANQYIYRLFHQEFWGPLIEQKLLIDSHANPHHKTNSGEVKPISREALIRDIRSAFLYEVTGREKPSESEELISEIASFYGYREKTVETNIRDFERIVDQILERALPPTSEFDQHRTKEPQLR